MAVAGLVLGRRDLRRDAGPAPASSDRA
jgi:hypothetical protein